MLRCNPGDFLAVLNIRWNYSPILESAWEKHMNNATALSGCGGP